MNARSVLHFALPLALAACGGEIPAGPDAEDPAALGTGSRPWPACGAACATNVEDLFWKGHDSVPQWGSDVGIGKTARDAMYCLFRDANRASLAGKSIGSGWNKQGVETRVIVSQANPPTATAPGLLSGWHAMSLTVFGKTLDADVQWFELRFPTEGLPQKFAYYYLNPATHKLGPVYETPTGYYADVRSDGFDGTKNLYGQFPQPTLDLRVSQPAIETGSDLQPWSAPTDRTSYPAWEVGYDNLQWGQLLSSSTPSDTLTAQIPIVDAGKWISFALIAEAQGRHFLRFHEEPSVDAFGDGGAMALEMGTKTHFAVSAKVKVSLPFFGDYEYQKGLFSWTPLDSNITLGKVVLGAGRTITSHTWWNGSVDANPQGWINNCLTAPPLPAAPAPNSDVSGWVNSVIDNVVDCTWLPDGEIPLGALCDKFKDPLPTYP